MESQLTKERFLVGDALTIADVSLYSYSHVAHEGGFDLDEFPAVVAWLNRVAASEKHVPMGSR